jgi:hypothetical protein
MISFLSGLEWLETKERFSNPLNCQECAYRCDCEAYWRFCPYTGEDARLKRADVEVLE